MKYPNEMLKQAKHSVMCEYKLIDKLNNFAEGNLYFNGIIAQFISGKYGKGFAPEGKYRAYKVLHENRKAFRQFNFGWQVPLEPQFKTDRRKLAIHPDGNVKGTLGCIGLDFQSIDENIALFNKFRDYFDKHDILEVEIVIQSA